VLSYIGHGETAEGALFLAMEWLAGEDLKARLARGPLAASDAIKLATRVAEALGVEHARGIVHRDLKPSNLFLPGGRIEQVEVLDFGIAQREGGTHLTQTGMLLGTPGYMAPEQARGSKDAIDARADVFALGCVLFECLLGRPPFDGDSTVGVLSEILFSEAPRVSALWPEVPRTWMRWWPRCWRRSDAAAERRRPAGGGARRALHGARLDRRLRRERGAGGEVHDALGRAAVPVRRAARARHRDARDAPPRPRPRRGRGHRRSMRGRSRWRGRGSAIPRRAHSAGLAIVSFLSTRWSYA
jgi:hypothetical protein